MIIWLASCPKSGNTWVRAFISSLIFDTNKENSLENLKKIRGYPLTSDFYDLLDSFDSLLESNIRDEMNALSQVFPLLGYDANHINMFFSKLLLFNIKLNLFFHIDIECTTSSIFNGSFAKRIY